MQVLIDASTRATRRVRPQSSDLYELMEVLDSQPFNFSPVRSEDRHVPFYGGVFPAVPSNSQAGCDPTGVGHRLGPPSLKYNKTVARFSDMFNLT